MLKGYMFYWRTPDGITDSKGTIHYPVHKKVVIATTKKEAREIFKASKQGLEKIMCDQSGGKAPYDIDELARKVLTTCELAIREFPLQRGQTA